MSLFESILSLLRRWFTGDEERPDYEGFRALTERNIEKYKDLPFDGSVLNLFPDTDHPWEYGYTDAIKIAELIRLYQNEEGGWNKNHQLRRYHSPDEIDYVLDLVAANDGMGTNYDNGSVWKHIYFMHEVYLKTGEDTYRDVVLRGLECIINTQKSGAWENKVHKHITYNDDATQGVMFLLFDVLGSDNGEWDYVRGTLRDRLDRAYERGIESILRCQVIVDGVGIWGQQHSHDDLLPTRGRNYEPAGWAPMETINILKVLRSYLSRFPTGSRSERVQNAFDMAIAWYIKYRHTGLDWCRDGATEGWGRYHEIPSGRIIFGNRDGGVFYDFWEMPEERRGGYYWGGSWPLVVIPELKEYYNNQ